MRRKGDGLLHEYSSFEDEDLADVRYLLGSDVGERLPKEPRKRADSTSQAWKRQRSMMPTVWIFLTILGGIMALTGYAIDTAVQGLHYRRLQLATLSGIWIVDALLWLLLPILIAVLAAMCGHFISVEAQGSGIPEMRVLLSGAILSNFLSLKAFFAKVIGVTLALGGGLSIGKEGPFVHIASIIGFQMYRFKLFRKIVANESLKIQLLAAAIAAGVTSAFGSPVGGLLFSIEVTTSYFPVSNLWRGFYCSVVTVYIYTVSHANLGLADLFDNTQFQPLGIDAQTIAYAILGMLCGLMAAFFIYCTAYLLTLRRTAGQRANRAVKRVVRFFDGRYRYTILIASITALVTYPLFLRQPDHETINQMFLTKDLWRAENVEHWSILSVYGTTVAFVIVKLVLTCFSLALPIPCGVYTPIFAAGAAFGRFYGEILSLMFSSIEPGTYAVVGAAALTAGTTRTLSTAVIVFELTGQLHHMLPVLLATILGYTVAGYYSVSIYDVLKYCSGLPHLPALDEVSRGCVAGDIMQTDLTVVTSKTSYADIIKILRRTNYYHFPVIQSSSEYFLIGSISRHHLEELVHERETLIKIRTGIDCTQFRSSSFIEKWKYHIDNRAGWRRGSTGSVLSGANSPGRGDLTPEEVAIEMAEDMNGHEPIEIDKDRTISPLHSAFIKSSPPTSPPSTSSASSHGVRTPPAALSAIASKRLREVFDPTASLSGTSVDTFDSDTEYDYGDTIQSLPPRARDEESDEVVYTSYMSRAVDITKLSSITNQAPFHIIAQTPLRKVHFLFTMLNLNQIYVVKRGKVVGVITKQDLILGDEEEKEESEE